MSTIYTGFVALALAILSFGNVANATEPSISPGAALELEQFLSGRQNSATATNGFGGSATSIGSPTILDAFSFEMAGCPKTSAASVRVLPNLKSVKFVNFTDERLLTQLHRFAVQCREERKDVTFFSTLVLQAFDNEVAGCPKWTRLQVHQDLRGIIAGTQFSSKEAVLILSLAGSAAGSCAMERDKK